MGSRPKRNNTAIEKETTLQTNDTITNNLRIIELLTYEKSVGRKKGWGVNTINVYTQTNHHFEKHNKLFLTDLNHLEGFMEGHPNLKRNCIDVPRNKTNYVKKQETSSTSEITRKNLHFVWSDSCKYPNV